MRKTHRIKLSRGSLVVIAVFVGFTSIAIFPPWTGTDLLLAKITSGAGIYIGWSLLCIHVYEFFRSGTQGGIEVLTEALPFFVMFTIGILMLVNHPRGNAAIATSLAIAAIYTGTFVYNDLFYKPTASARSSDTLDEKMQQLSAIADCFVKDAVEHANEIHCSSGDSTPVDFCGLDHSTSVDFYGSGDGCVGGF